MSAPEITIRSRGVSKQTLTQSVCDELHLIAKANKGHLTPESVLLNARDLRSPIHNCFEWDDTQAGERFRLIQAAILIRSVRVSVETHPQDKPKIIRAFVSVTTRKETHDEDEESELINSYVPLDIALKTDDYRNQMLENAFRELRSFQRKYAILKELTGVFSAIEGLSIPA